MTNNRTNYIFLTTSKTTQQAPPIEKHSERSVLNALRVAGNQPGWITARIHVMTTATEHETTA